MLEIKVLDELFSVCKIADVSGVNFDADFFFLGKTDEEISLVCLDLDVPNNCIVEDKNWRGFRIQGELEFSLVGILAKISNLLAEHQIPIFAVSTYNTDYVFVKENYFANTISILAANEYKIL